MPNSSRVDGGTGWQANQYSRDGFSADAILVEEVLGRPGSAISSTLAMSGSDSVACGKAALGSAAGAGTSICGVGATGAAWGALERISQRTQTRQNTSAARKPMRRIGLKPAAGGRPARNHQESDACPS